MSLDYDTELRVAGIGVQVDEDQRSWSYLYADAGGLLKTAGDLDMTRDPISGFLTGTTLGSLTTAQILTGIGIALPAGGFATAT